jgi:hypothetical protein
MNNIGERNVYNIVENDEKQDYDGNLEEIMIHETIIRETRGNIAGSNYINEKRSIANKRNDIKYNNSLTNKYYCSKLLISLLVMVICALVSYIIMFDI